MKNNKTNNGQWGLALGLFLGGFHLIWVILVALKIAQPLIDWVFKLHMIRPPYVIAPFDAWMALGLIIMTFIVGYAVGWIFAAICNALCKK